MTVLLDGSHVSSHFRSAMRDYLSSYTQMQPPKLVAILVGNHAPSEIYVGLKKKHCLEVGIEAEVVRFHDDVSQKELISAIQKHSLDPAVDGLIVQLPLPLHLDRNAIIDAIDPSKDIDGFHPLNLAALIEEKEGFIPATPLGIELLLNHYQIDLCGKQVLVIGRSLTVGRPLSILLSQNRKGKNGTVTLAHSQSGDLTPLCQRADLIVAAAGKPLIIKKEMVREGSIIIDVGIHRLSYPNGKTRIVGDVDFEEVFHKASMITPVPKGVGPMTIAGLLYNTLKSYAARRDLPPFSPPKDTLWLNASKRK